MTTIAFKKEEDEIIVAADSQVTMGSKKMRLKETKIFEKNGIVYGFAGSLCVLNTFRNADLPRPTDEDGSLFIQEKLLPKIKKVYKKVQKGLFDKESKDDLDLMIILTFNSRIFTIDWDSCIVEYDNFYSIGSGSTYALGALSAGASAEDSIKIASQYDIYSGFEIILSSDKTLITLPTEENLLENNETEEKVVE